MSDLQRVEVDHNHDALQRQLGNLLPNHRGEYALMKGRVIVEYYSTPGNAYRAGLTRYEDRLFSIQEVTDEPIDLGFFSHVGN